MIAFDVVDWELHLEPLLYSDLFGSINHTNSTLNNNRKKKPQGYLPHKSLCKIFDEVIDLTPVGRNTSRSVTKHMKNNVSTKKNQTPNKETAWGNYT